MKSSTNQVVPSTSMIDYFRECRECLRYFAILSPRDQFDSQDALAETMVGYRAHADGRQRGVPGFRQEDPGASGMRRDAMGACSGVEGESCKETLRIATSPETFFSSPLLTREVGARWSSWVALPV